MIYLDVLLLVNFVVGAMLLLAAGLVCGAECRGGRAVCGAAVAAASSLALLAPEAPWPLALLYKGATGAAAVAAAYGWPGYRAFARLAFWYVLLNLALTGAAVLPGVQTNNFSVYVSVSPGLLLACAGAVYGVLRLAFHLWGRGRAGVFPAELLLAPAGPALPVLVLRDTGLSVQEPLSGRPVVLVRRAAVEAGLSPALRTYLEEYFSGASPLPPPQLGVRMVPCGTVAGHCVLPAVPAAELRWQHDGRAQHLSGLYAAFCDVPPPANGWEVLLGAE